MPANGLGVLLDNAVPPLRITYHGDIVADVQSDQEEVLTFPRYDYSKIWACMGTAGANGIVRAGFVEEGNALTGWTAGTIETVAGGVPVGVQYWGTNVAYNPFGGLALNDFGLYGCLAPFDEFLWHLAAGLGAAPPVAYEYWNGAAWAALTLTTTPDWTCALSLNQRLRLVRPSNWAAATPAQLGLVGLANPGTYFFFRVRLTGAIGAAPAANTAYNDFFKGHWRFFYCNYDLKRGDDLPTGGVANFLDDGNFSIRFRDGFGLDGRTSVGGMMQHGSADLVNTRRPTIGKGSTVIQTGRRLTLWGGTYAGVFFGTIPRHKDHTTTMDFQIRANLDELEMYGCQLNGWMNGVLGGTGSTAIDRIDGLRVTPHPLYLGITTAFPIITTLALANDGNSQNIVVDVPANNNFSIGVRTSVIDARIEGITLTHDEFTIAQITANTRAHLFDINWGGPTNKTGSNNVETREYRRLTFLVREDETGLPLFHIPIRIFGTDGVRQNPGDAAFPDDATDLNGKYNQWQSIPFGFSNSEANKGIFLVEKFNATVSTLFDEPMLIQVNPADHPHRNPLYMPLTFLTRFPRKLLPDVNLDFSEQDWQRFDLEVVIALPRAPVVPGIINPYTRQPVPDTEFVPSDIPPVPYERQDVPATPFVPTPIPGTGFTPCDPVLSTPFRPKARNATVYTHKTVPDVDYAECGTEDVEEDVILLVPGMVMDLSDP